MRETGIRPHVATDQVSAAYGGFTRIGFKRPHDRGELDTCHAKAFAELKQHLGFYFTRVLASEVAQKQAKITPNKERELTTMLQLVDEAESTVTTRQRSVCEFGRLPHESCQIKLSLIQRSQTATSMRFTTLSRVLAPWGKQLGGGAAPTCAVRGTAGVASAPKA